MEALLCEEVFRGLVESYSRGVLGGGFNGLPNDLAASFRNFDIPTNDGFMVGFRVASVPVPEPSAFLVSVLLVSAVLIRRRRSTR